MGAETTNSILYKKCECGLLSLILFTWAYYSLCEGRGRPYGDAQVVPFTSIGTQCMGMDCCSQCDSYANKPPCLHLRYSTPV